ncbi:MAG: RNA polymerase sigma factor [Patescibacteria group bacterium]
MENNELALIYACQRGEAEAFGQVYEKYFKKIYSFVYYRTSHKESTEDLVSLIFSKALENINKFQSSKGSFSSWLYKIARNTVIDYYRGHKNIQNLDDIEDLSDFSDISDNMDRKKALSDIQNKLAQLSSNQREIVIMRVWEDLSYKEIAEIVGKSEANCKMIFSRGIKELRLSLASLIYLVMMLID